MVGKESNGVKKCRTKKRIFSFLNGSPFKFIFGFSDVVGVVFFH